MIESAEQWLEALDSGTEGDGVESLGRHGMSKRQNAGAPGILLPKEIGKSGFHGRLLHEEEQHRVGIRERSFWHEKRRRCHLEIFLT